MADTTAPAYEANWGTDWTLLVNSQLVQFTFVQLATTGYLVTCAAGALALGVTQDSPAGSAGTPLASAVRTMAPTKILAGGNFNQGALLASNSSGQAVVYTGATVYTGTPYIVSGSQVLGIALQAGSTGILTSMLFRPSGLCAAGD
jgi:hypothetical protein